MFIIGIDPDYEKCGVATTQHGSLINLSDIAFFDLIDGLKSLHEKNQIKLVVIEAGWLIKKSMFHDHKRPYVLNEKKTPKGIIQTVSSSKGIYYSLNISQNMARKVGLNHGVGMLIAEFCKRNHITYDLVKPKGKIKADHFKKITGWKGRSNQDQRDAAMLIWGRR